MYLLRIWWIVSICFLCFGARSQTNPSQPNILFILADDLGVDAMNGYFSSPIMPTTPTLDSLRSRGITFKNAWASPRCSPTRGAILSGKYGNKSGLTGVPGNLDTSHVSLFKAIEEAAGGAYDDALFGKWHISSPLSINHPADHGVDHYEGDISGNTTDYYNWVRTLNGLESNVTEYITEYLTTSAIDWINARNKPWFVMMSHYAPHSPFHVPPAGTYSVSPTNSDRRKFLAMIENVDHETNRLLSNIPQAVRDNTIIIFASDNGTPASVHQVFPSGSHKSTMYQGGVHVPLVVTGPSVTRINEVDTGLVHLVDLYATILESVGGSVNGGIYNSRSFEDAFSATAPLRKYNYSELENAVSVDYAIRDDRYKLIQFLDGTKEFYDLLEDSLELVNLIDILTPYQDSIYLDLHNEGLRRLTGWSCKDDIQNGMETSIDCGGYYCFDCNVALPCNRAAVTTCSDIELDSTIVSDEYISSNHRITSQFARMWTSDEIFLEPGFEFSGGVLEANIINCTVSGIGDNDCDNDNSTSYTNIGCCESPTLVSTYSEFVANDVRTITSNCFPNHDFCNNGNTLSPVTRTYTVDETPALSYYKTSILSPNNNPRYWFGIALNGVLIAPAPATPFIFTNVNTGEYNWDWVYEPTNNQGLGQGNVKLDCASAHSGPQGYHYHGNMFQYIEEIVQPGLTATNVPPAEVVPIGWAADGYPILYRFGPDASGTVVELQSSYRLKYGNRPGDGISAPCGSYNGKYTVDYEYQECLGDLDECNGIQQTITINTAVGQETFDYFYVITAEFPQISRCFSGDPDNSFR